MISATRGVALLAVVLVCGCISGRASVGRSGASREDWPAVLARAEGAANNRRYAEADRILTDFAARYPRTEEAIETTYWRGLFKLDPANRDESISAGALLDSYLENDSALAHRAEAEILRRLISRIESLPTSTAAASSSASGPAAVERGAELKARDAEIQKLKEDLAKANEELERIKRRLTQPVKP